MTDISKELIYKGSDIATKLDISESTLRKYSQELEKSGWSFRTNERRARVFTENDLELFTEFLKLRNELNMSVEKSADMSVRYFLSSDSLTHNESANVINALETKETVNFIQEMRRYNAEIEKAAEANHAELKNEIRELKETLDEMSKNIEANNNKTFFQRIFKR